MHLDLPLTWANSSNIFQHGGLRFKKNPHLPRLTMGPPKNTRTLINNIILLTRTLPTSVPPATNADKIFAVMNSSKGESTWHTFNKHFDGTVWRGLLWFHWSIAPYSLWMPQHGQGVQLSQHTRCWICAPRSSYNKTCPSLRWTCSVQDISVRLIMNNAHRAIMLYTALQRELFWHTPDSHW
jgi:hypothetical protein